jgi:hypothetical protein
MIDMKLDKQSEPETLIAGSDSSEYPYGLQLSLDNEQLSKLGMTDLPAIDTEFTLVAKVCVVGTSQYDAKDSENPHRSVQLQIEAMELSPSQEEGEKSAADRLYG